MSGATFYTMAHELLARRDAGASFAELASDVGWQANSVKAIISRARRGQLRPPGRLRRNAWTDDMDAILEDHWESENAQQIAGRLAGLRPGITDKAVNARARRLGLEKPSLFANHADWWTKNLEARQ